ncbi:hypothetical protein M6D93_00595 [Jatrophihabitans telluris]|uniref:Integral membrane protein n=1 Tax=Jatrophihabitans telluris TaxID=2038343 RepID=A0ABY4QXY6_9ACTN|nr:hypothetical protein [Jatrophihabitans telluris]UQX88518.1 hypothetical protein M6D93_00595 [Jatrophihabitans telluris]
MDRVSRLVSGVARALSGLLPDGRRDWVHALLVEADQVPAAPARLAWLGGGLWMVMKEVVMNRIVQAMAFLAGALGLVLVGWPGASTNSATPVNRMYVVVTLALLIGLPLLVRRFFGPVRPGWVPRAVRVGGYAVILGLVAALVEKHRLGSRLGSYFPVVLGNWAMYVGFLLVLGGYVAGLLVLTCRRLQFAHRVLPSAVGVGAVTAGVLYALAPFGGDGAIERVTRTDTVARASALDYLVVTCFALAALAVPVGVHAMTTRLARRDSRPGVLPAPRQAVLATIAAASIGAMLVALFTSLTIALLPHHVPRPASGDGICHTCVRPTVVIPANLRQQYDTDGSIGSAGGAAILALLVVPVFGATIATLCNAQPVERPARNPRLRPS